MKNNKKIAISLSLIFITTLGISIYSNKKNTDKDIGIINEVITDELPEGTESYIQFEDGIIYEGDDFYNSLSVDGKIFYLSYDETGIEKMTEYFDKFDCEYNSFLCTFDEYANFVQQDNVTYEDGTYEVPHVPFNDTIVDWTGYQVLGTAYEDANHRTIVKETGFKQTEDGYIEIKEAIRYSGDNEIDLIDNLRFINVVDGFMTTESSMINYRIHNSSRTIDKAFVDIIHTNIIDASNYQLYQDMSMFKGYVTHGYDINEFLLALEENAGFLPIDAIRNHTSENE